jgi:hypothetical protein
MNNASVVNDSLAGIKEQLLKECLDILKTTKDGVLKGLEYISAQIPDLIKQFLSWELAVGIILLIVGSLLFAFGIWMLRKAVYWLKKEGVDAGVGCMIAGGVSAVVGIGMTLYEIMKITQILVAPKIFLIQWIINNASNLGR